jgi:hypothetical protein
MLVGFKLDLGRTYRGWNPSDKFLQLNGTLLLLLQFLSSIDSVGCTFHFFWKRLDRIQKVFR